MLIQICKIFAQSKPDFKLWCAEILKFTHWRRYITKLLTNPFRKEWGSDTFSREFCPLVFSTGNIWHMIRPNYDNQPSWKLKLFSFYAFLFSPFNSFVLLVPEMGLYISWLSQCFFLSNGSLSSPHLIYWDMSISLHTDDSVYHPRPNLHRH